MKRRLQFLLFLLLLPMGMLAQGQTWQTAKALEAGRTATGNLSEANPEEWYVIEVTENGAINISVTSDDNLSLGFTVLYALNSDNEVKERANIWGAGEFVANDLAKGTYYLRVSNSSGEGAYTLKYIFTSAAVVYKNETEPNDTWQQAQPLGRDQTVTGHMGYYYYDDRDIEDWWCFEVPKEGTVKISITAHDELGLGVTSLYVLDENNEMQERASIWGNGDIIVGDAAVGTYYVRVSYSSGQGAYSLQYKLELPLYATDQEPNNAWQQAQSLGRGHTATGHLGYYYYDDRDIEDWWCFEVPKEGTVKINITAHDELELGYTLLYVLDENNEMQERTSIIWGNGDIIVSDAAVGTYYIRVSYSNGQGAYSLQYKLELPLYATDQEPNNDWNNALLLEEGETISGHLGYRYFDETDIADWYFLTFPAKGDITFTYYTQAGLELGFVNLYKLNDNNEIQEMGSIWSTGEDGHQQLTVNDLDAGAYYLKVTCSGGSGYYLLAYAATLGSVEPQEQLPDDPSDDPHAQPVPDDGTGVTYTYDPETNTMTVVTPPPTPPYVFICQYPGETLIVDPDVVFPYDIFSICGDGDISVGATTPPGVIGGTFAPEDVSNRTLHVPEGTEDAYRSDENWGQFGNIVGDYGKQNDNISGPRLVVWLKSGEKVIYELADSPVTTFENGQLIIRTNNVTVPYDRRNVLRYTYEDLFTNIETDPAERRVQINREGDEVSFRGLPKGSTARIYSVSGQLVDQTTVPDNQSLTISLKNRPTGVYIIKAATETIKVMKK